jgi:hypothetical protein
LYLGKSRHLEVPEEEKLWWAEWVTVLASGSNRSGLR